MSLFDILIWSGTALTLVGLGMLVWCILRVARAKRTSPSPEELRETLQKVLPFNLGALFLSAIGLMMVVIGVLLG